MNPNQILFATDFSDRDLRAFKHTCRLALDWHAKLHVLHVERDHEPPFSTVDPSKELKRFIPGQPAIEFEQTVRTGNPADEILKFADEQHVRLIVLGTHGRSGLGRVVSGSIAENVMRKAKCAVMTLRDLDTPCSDRRMNYILVPADFSVYGYAAVDFASCLALTTNADLTICYVDDSDPSSVEDHERIWKQLRQFVPTNSKVRYSHKIFLGNPGEEICKYANSKPYDYIVIGTHGRSGITRAVRGSVAEYVVRHANCPVISVKPTNQRIAMSC